MRIDSQANGSSLGRDHCATDKTAIAARRCGTVIAIALTLILSPGSLAFGQQPDLWQTYMSAAARANSSGDFETKAVLLARALDVAQSHRAHNLRPMLTTLTKIPLMLAYVEQDKEALWKPIAEAGTFRLDVGPLDMSMKPFIFTARRFGNAYDDRWRRNQREPGFKQRARLYGAEHLLRVEAAFRKKLMPENETGLAEAQALLGMVIARRSAQDSQEPFREAIGYFETVQQRRSRIDAVTRRFSVARDDADVTVDDGANLESNQFFAMTLAMRNILAVAEDSLTKKDLKSFQSAIAAANDLRVEITRATSRIRSSWPRSPTFGQIAVYSAWMYSAQYKGTKLDPKLFPDSFAQGKAAFEEALSIYGYNYGPTSELVRTVARDFANLLRTAGRNDEAAELEKRYSQQ